ncbi:MAG: DUF192 domain-containing protein [Clostridiaceae bacterium]
MNKKLIYNSKVISEVFIADTFFKRLIGYMFRKQPHYETIVFNNCNSIHTFFMRFYIDVIFINKDMEIVKKVENLKGGKVVLPVKDAIMVIEGVAMKFKDFKVGDKITLRF